jgi:hypothetical protein
MPAVKPIESQPIATAWTKLPLRELLEGTETFVAIAELVTSRGLISDPASSRMPPAHANPTP